MQSAVRPSWALKTHDTAQRTACGDSRELPRRSGRRAQYRRLAKTSDVSSSGAKKISSKAARWAVALATRAAPDKDRVCAEAVVGTSRASAIRTPVQTAFFITAPFPVPADPLLGLGLRAGASLPSERAVGQLHLG